MPQWTGRSCFSVNFTHATSKSAEARYNFFVLFTFIEAMRKEPPQVKQRFVMVVTAVIVGIIGILWLIFYVGGLLIGLADRTPTAETTEIESGGITSPYAE